MPVSCEDDSETNDRRPAILIADGDQSARQRKRLTVDQTHTITNQCAVAERSRKTERARGLPIFCDRFTGVLFASSIGATSCLYWPFYRRLHNLK